MTEQIVGSEECQECPLMELCLTEISKHEVRQEQLEKATRLYMSKDAMPFDEKFVELILAEELAVTEGKISEEIDRAQARLLRLSLAALQLNELSAQRCNGLKVGLLPRVTGWLWRFTSASIEFSQRGYMYQYQSVPDRCGLPESKVIESDIKKISGP